ncbi:MAG TPA: type II and III secretion system protein family protein [Tepidisphaeraceae bacterium]|jgi:pilus assembly protein CpaC|nr:type II and III secretion system protein family protein [Tepidisphaeraceae bacterium]
MFKFASQRCPLIRTAGLLLATIACALMPSAAAADDTAPQTRPAQADQPLIATGIDELGGRITLTVNQSRLIRTAVPIHTVDVPQPEVILAKVVSPTDIMLTAKKPGYTQIVVWDDRGRSQAVEIVVSADLSALTQELNSVFPDAKVEPSLASGAIVLRGRVHNAKVADQIVQVATPFAGNAKVVNLLEVGGGQQVMLQVRFAEVSKSVTSALAVDFGISNGSTGFGGSIIGGVAPIGVVNAPTNINAGALSIPFPGSGTTQFGAGVAGKTPFEIFLTALRQNNLVRVLAEPNLTVMSGGEASFMAGGEYPYPVPQNTGAGGVATITIEYKPYGVRLNFSPVVLGDGRVRLRVRPEVSDLDYTNAVTLNGFLVPGLVERNADTTVELNEGQTLSLAGLLSTRATATSSITPVLGDMPILGPLFRSVRYVREETELVVLVTPRLVSAMNPDQVPDSVGEHWRYPTEGQLFLHADLGGPAADTTHAPSTMPPRMFQGTYGFTPAQAAGSAAR